MPSGPNAFREHGRHCAEVAARLTDPPMQEAFDALAKSWLKLASDLEARRAAKITKVVPRTKGRRKRTTTKRLSLKAS
jgi:hypothetical protein